jgi:hypothetical protein
MAMSQIQPRDPLEGWTNHQGEFLYICGTWFHSRMKKQKGCNDAHLV